MDFFFKIGEIGRNAPTVVTVINLLDSSGKTYILINQSCKNGNIVKIIDISWKNVTLFSCYFKDVNILSNEDVHKLYNLSL